MVNIYSGTITETHIPNIARYLVPPNTNISFGGRFTNANNSAYGWLQIRYDGTYWFSRRATYNDNFTIGPNSGYSKGKIKNSTEIPYYTLSLADVDYAYIAENRQATLTAKPSASGTVTTGALEHIHICWKTSEISDINDWRDQISNLINDLSYSPYFDNATSSKKRPNTAPIYLNDHNFRHPIYEPALAHLWLDRKKRRR